MALADFLGKSEGRRRADQALIEAEDRLTAYDENEGRDLSFHARKDADRTRVIVARQRSSHELFRQLSDRNWRLTVAIGAALMVKGVVSFQDIVHWIGML